MKVFDKNGVEIKIMCSELNEINVKWRGGQFVEVDANMCEVIPSNSDSTLNDEILDTWIKIANQFGVAGGCSDGLRKMTLEDFIKVCTRNNIKVSVKYQGKSNDH